MSSTVLFVIVSVAVILAVFFLIVGLWPRRFLYEAAQEAKAAEKPSFIEGVKKVLVRKLGKLNDRFVSGKMAEKFKRRYIMAGEPGTMTAGEFLGLQEIGAFFFLIFGIIVCNATGWWMLLPGFPVLGFILPQIWLNDLIKKRHLLITRALPYNLDLLTLSVEAGLDFAGAVGKVVEKGKSGPLRNEFEIMLSEMKMGKTREEALRNLGERVGLPVLSTFVSTLIQADRMGTPLGRVLRIQSTQLRIDRTQRAEKLANEAPVKMLFPLIFCIFPCVFLIIFGPILFQFVFGRI